MLVFTVPLIWVHVCFRLSDYLYFYTYDCACVYVYIFALGNNTEMKREIRYSIVVQSKRIKSCVQKEKEENGFRVGRKVK